MVLFPNCKINLGLRVLNKRPDGFHDLDTIFYPIPLKDAAEINSCYTPVKGSQKEFELSLSGVPIAGDVSDNLCTKAWQLIKNDFPDLPPMRMNLLKAIPSGAGLGGGSSDAAFTLKLINQKYNLQLGTQKLMDYALRLGSDCPFFIINKPCHALGRGELLTEINLDLEDYYFVLVHPDIHISTGWAFSKIEPAGKDQKLSMTEIISLPVEEWKHHLVNDFEKPVFLEYPGLEKIKQQLYDQGAMYSGMTGSGSCIYGLFKKTNPSPVIKSELPFTIYNLKDNH